MFNQKHILVIDDDEKLSNLLKSYLNGQGYHVDLAENTAVARDKMHALVHMRFRRCAVARP